MENQMTLILSLSASLAGGAIIAGIIYAAVNSARLQAQIHQDHEKTRELIRAIHITSRRERREMRLENQDWYKDFSIWLRRIDEKVDPER